MARQHANKKSNEFSNIDVVIVAAYKLGAKHKHVDTEDVAVLAEQIAPGRFSWKKYKDRTDLELVRLGLRDGCRPENGNYIEGKKKEGWTLTDDGAVRAESLLSQIDSIDLSRVVRTAEEKRVDQWLKRERGRMLGSEILERFSRDGHDAISDREAEVFFKLDEYIRGDSRKRKVDRLTKAFRNDPELGSAVTELARKVLEK